MLELDEYEMDGIAKLLHIAKRFADRGRLDLLLQASGKDAILSVETYLELEYDLPCLIFEDVTVQRHPEDDWRMFSERTVYIMRDSLLSRFDQLCREYEATRGILPIENPFVSTLEEAVNRALRMNSYKPIRRSSLADAFRSATGDIYHRLVVKDAGVPQIINVYCRDNRGPKGIISRELVKETLHEDTNEYKKLANISLDRGSGVFSYDNLEADPNVDALSCCQDAQELFALYQTCASRRQIDTLLQNYLDTMQAVKAARGRIYFIPRDYMPKLALFEDFIALLEQHNQHKYADRLPLDANSMFVVDDEKQRSKMALAFYRTIQKDLAEYEKRATHLIQSGNQSPAIMDRMVLSIRELERKKIYYESILKQELHEVDEQYTSLRYLSDELQIRARSIQAQKRLAA